MRYRTTHHLGFYLTPNILYGTTLTRHRSGNIQEQSHYQMTLNDDPTPFMSALSQHKITGKTYHCHVTLNQDYVHQQVLSIDNPLPPVYLPKYLAHHSITLFQHAWESLYCDYLPIQTDSATSTYLISACKQSIIKEHLSCNLPSKHRLATLQIDSLCGLHLNLLNNHSRTKPYTILYCDSMQLTHYQFTRDNINFYETYSVTKGYDHLISELQESLTQAIDTLYITGPNEQLYNTLIDQLSDSHSLIPLHEALVPKITLSQNDHTQRHHELITTLTALTSRSYAC